MAEGDIQIDGLMRPTQSPKHPHGPDSSQLFSHVAEDTWGLTDGDEFEEALRAGSLGWS